MKIAYIYPRNKTAAWGISQGSVRALRSLSHKVFDGGHDGPAYPVPLPSLEGLDGVILGSPEHLWPFIEVHQLKGEWPEIFPCPVLGWLAESMERPDFPISLHKLHTLCNKLFSPSWGDARKFKLSYLPFGVDTGQMKSTKPWYKRSITYGFIGGLYQKRKDFLESVAGQLPFPIHCGNAQAETIHGYDAELSQKLYSSSLNDIKVFVVLPTLSQLIVTKVYEGAACGCCVVTPYFEDIPILFPEDVVFPYDPEDTQSFILACMDAARKSPSHESISLIRTKHRIEDRMIRLLKEIR